MTFIEVEANEDESAVQKEVSEAYVALYNISPPKFHFGRLIVWQGRTFKEVRLPKAPESLVDEDRIYRTLKFSKARARIQAGSVRGSVFTTPPMAGDAAAARVKEDGRCGSEYIVKPFHYRSWNSASGRRSCYCAMPGPP